MSLTKTTGFLPVLSALLGNILVTIIKLIAAFLSGSSTMFSESIHSFADTFNQVLLMIGINRSTKKADEEFIYGYGHERFFWAIISACGIFFIGAGVTIYRGILFLMEPKELEIGWITFFVLAVSFVIEATTFYIALREIRSKYPTLSWSERLRVGDPSTQAVLFEDGLATLGVIIATASLILTNITGNQTWDAVGSIIIGVLLGIMAVILIIKNRGYLIGMSMPEEMQDVIIDMLNAEPAIEKVLDFKSTTMDVGVYRIKCEIEFNGYVLLKEIYKTNSLRDQYDEVKDDYEEFKKFCVDYADRIPRLVGKKIDDIETKLKKEYPGIKYIDIEIN